MADRANVLRQAHSLLDKPARRRFVRVCVLTVVMAAFELVGVTSILPFLSVLTDPEVIHEQPLLSRAYDVLNVDSTSAFLRYLGGTAFVLLVLSAIVRSLGMYVLTNFVQMLRHTIGAKLLETYLRQPYEFFLDRHTGDLAKSILSETDQVVNQVFQPITNLLANGVTFLALTSLVIALDPFTAIIVAGVLTGAYALIYVGVRRPLERMGRQRVKANRGRFEATGEALGGVKDIKLLGREQAYLDKFETPSLTLARISSRTAVMGALPRYAIETVGFGGILLLSLSLVTTDGEHDASAVGAAVPTLGLYALAGYRMLPAVQAIYLALSQLRVGAPAIANVHRDLQGAHELPTLARATARGMQRDLEIDALSYRYPNSDNGLNGISFSIPAGTTVGIVGSTGAGKTTLVDVILGLLSPQSGRLIVDGDPIGADNVRSWQASIGYVPQTIFLADASLRENIALGVPKSDIDDGRVRECARLAQMAGYIDELPARYDTEVGERGIRLSGGQRQRIGIARALYHDPDVLVFDEATSALDNLTERALMDAVFALHGTKTILMIAHRLSTVRECDKIVVLDRGSVAGVGKYDDLVENNAAFQAIAMTAETGSQTGAKSSSINTPSTRPL